MYPIVLKRTSSDNPDFRLLVKELDEELTSIYGAKQAFYNPLNALLQIQHVIVAYADDIPVGCGAIKKYNEDAMEIKRMYVKPTYRNKGVARSILNALELWTKELKFNSCVLETGDKQPDAIYLYKKAGFDFIPNYGPYADDNESVCMRKEF
jgi:GNAT superfamily N-acetyltransferase